MFIKLFVNNSDRILSVNIHKIDYYYTMLDKSTGISINHNFESVKETPEEIDQLIEKKLHRNLYI